MYYSLNRKGEISELVEVEILLSKGDMEWIQVNRPRRPGEIAWVRIREGEILLKGIKKLPVGRTKKKCATYMWNRYSPIEFYAYLTELRNKP